MRWEAYSLLFFICTSKKLKMENFFNSPAYSMWVINTLPVLKWVVMGTASSIGCAMPNKWFKSFASLTRDGLKPAP